MPDSGCTPTRPPEPDAFHESAPPAPRAHAHDSWRAVARTSGAGDASPHADQAVEVHGAATDEQLLRIHLAGDPQAFNELVRRHRTLLRVVALRVLENHHDADDAVQDGLLRAFRGAHTYSARSSVGAWLRTIVENTARTAARARARDQRRSTEVSESHSLVDTGPIGADPAEVAGARAAVAEALAQIPAQWRHTFELVKVNGLSYAEAAEVLAIPLGTVRSRINRANAALAAHRSRLRQDGGNHLGSAASLRN